MESSTDEIEYLDEPASDPPKTASGSVSYTFTKKLGTYFRPPLSYACLTYLAFKNSPTPRLRVTQIYAFIAKHFPYYSGTSPRGWKNSIRHNLSMNRSFTKITVLEFDQYERHCTWIVTPERLEKMDGEMRQQIKKHWNFVAGRCMKYPKDLVYIVEGIANDMKQKEGGTGKEPLVDEDLPDRPVFRNDGDLKFTQLDLHDKRLGVVLYAKTVPLPEDFYCEEYSLSVTRPT